MSEIRDGEEGFVYFALSENGLCKIGCSADPAVRVGQLQGESEAHLTLVHRVATNDMFWLENKFHCFFNDCRSYGEWFHLDEKQLFCICKMTRHDRLVVCGRCIDDPACEGPLAIPGRVMGKKGGPARAAALTAERRREIARMGGAASAAKRRTRSQ